MSFDFQKMQEGKAAYRRKLAELPISEKLSLLDAMRERAISIRNAILLPASSVLREDVADYRADTGSPASGSPE